MRGCRFATILFLDTTRSGAAANVDTTRDSECGAIEWIGAVSIRPRPFFVRYEIPEVVPDRALVRAVRAHAATEARRLRVDDETGVDWIARNGEAEDDWVSERNGYAHQLPHGISDIHQDLAPPVRESKLACIGDERSSGAAWTATRDCSCKGPAQSSRAVDHAAVGRSAGAGAAVPLEGSDGKQVEMKTYAAPALGALLSLWSPPTPVALLSSRCAATTTVSPDTATEWPK